MSGRVLTIVDSLARTQWFTNTERRRVVFGIAAFALLLFSIFPRHYKAAVDLAPQDTTTAGLSSILSSLGNNYASLLGNHQPVEMDVTIARSYQVAERAAQKLGMIDNANLYASTASAVREIRSKVEVNALRGSIIEVEVRDRNPEAALKIASAYSDALQDQLTALSLEAAEYKRSVLQNRFVDVSKRLEKAKAAVADFRTKYRMSSPNAENAFAVGQVASLRNQITMTRMELARSLRFNTEESLTVKQLRSNLAVLENELKQSTQANQLPDGPTAMEMVQLHTKYADLEREEVFAQGLFDAYTRYLEGVNLEELTSSFNMRSIQAPYVDPTFQFNIWAVLALIGLVCFAVASELYIARLQAARRFAR